MAINESTCEIFEKLREQTRVLADEPCKGSHVDSCRTSC